MTDKKNEYNKNLPNPNINLIKLNKNIYREIGYEEHHEIPKPSLKKMKKGISLFRQILFSDIIRNGKMKKK